MAGAAAGLLLAGAWTDYPELVNLGSAGLATLLAAAAWLVVHPHLTVEREIRPRRVFEDGAARGLLTVMNVGRRHSPPLLAVETVGGQRIEVPIPTLGAGGSHQIEYPVPTPRRGRYVFSPLVVNQSDPLRLLRRRHALGVESVLHVFPRVHPLSMVRTSGPRDAEGPTASGAPMGGVAFHSLREYVLGDDWRLIHWGATARTGTLMARHLVVPDEPRQLIVLDTSAASYTADLFEDAVRVAASFCVAAEQAGLPMQLRTTDDPPRGTGDEWGTDLTTTLERLSTVDFHASGRGLVGLLDTVRDIVAADHGVILLVVTGRVDAYQADLLARVRPRFLSVSLAQLAPACTKPPATPRGVLAVAASTSAEFASSWNQLVPR